MLAADLHVHLDGSLRAGTLAELARRRGVCPQATTDDAFESGLVFREGMSLSACLRRFDVPVALLQEERDLERVAAELIQDCFSDGVRHAEIRLCPLLHTRGGLRPDDVLDAVLVGIESGIASGAGGGSSEWMSGCVIVSILEGMSDGETSRLVDLATRYVDRGVVGVDLAGDESLFRADEFATEFARARDAGLGITVHAGESGDARNVAAAVEKLGASRIGHGTSAPDDPSVLELLAERSVTVECCLTSNVHTGAVASYEEHPMRRFVEAGVPVVLATDNRFFSHTSLSREYDVAGERLRMEKGVLDRIALESARSSFLPPREREELERLIASSMGTGHGAAAPA